MHRPCEIKINKTEIDSFLFKRFNLNLIPYLLPELLCAFVPTI